MTNYFEQIKYHTGLYACLCDIGSVSTTAGPEARQQSLFRSAAVSTDGQRETTHM